MSSYDQPGTDFLQTFRNTHPRGTMFVNTFGVRAGANADGVLVGSLTPTAVGSCANAFTGGTVFTDLTTAANNATANDVIVMDATPVLNDALYVGHLTKPFTGIKATYSTATAYTGMTTLWEYYNGTTWVNLATSNVLVDSTASGTIAFKAAASTKFITWNVPTAWAKTTINGVLGYFVRMRVSVAQTGGTTSALADQLWVLLPTAGVGLPAPCNGQLVSVAFLTATTKSAANNDSIFQIINTKTGELYKFTATKAVAATVDTAPQLHVSLGDQLVLQQIKQDGTTEFAGVNISLAFQPL